MTNLLKIDSSARRTDNSESRYNSISKQLGSWFVDEWMSCNHPDSLIQRDLGLNPPSFISQEWIASVFTSQERRTPEQHALLEESDSLIDELDQADVIIITAPMYNYGMPAVLKAWFDQVVRIDETFTFDLARGDFPLEPIMSGKTLILLSSCGEFGFDPGGVREQMNHLGPHIGVISKYLGVENFYEIRSEYQEFADSRHQESLANARKEIIKLVNRLS
ncbi:FMN-dependent NADH-azoreductase [Neptunomonas antarctica]|uniref:FMN dependent NADH:quinone oxidoreductase n=1 Tax=Neptunomonas antarctica TaxID=619304 RepID=A0A1N7K2E5_9GAMM|nr:NAD(P)H-dependent oxidoreductase [Neptunomonas antarctica]SIS55759.1 FMN-dependent NADH-azoreductase [Neptunomonas antarctica]